MRTDEKTPPPRPAPSRHPAGESRGACGLVSRWYRTEAALADSSGYVKNHERGEVIPPHNGVCTRVLASREGFRRCNLSVKTLVNRLNEPGAPTRLVHSCHLGLTVIGVKPPASPDVTFCCGVSVKALDTQQKRTMADKLASIGLEPSQLRGWEEIPVLDAGDQQRLADLLETSGAELATKWPKKPTMADESRGKAELSGAAVVPLREQVQEFEREVILRGLIRTHWNRARLAKLLGISRTTLLSKIEAYHLSEPTNKE